MEAKSDKALAFETLEQMFAQMENQNRDVVIANVEVSRLQLKGISLTYSQSPKVGRMCYGHATLAMKVFASAAEFPNEHHNASKPYPLAK